MNGALSAPIEVSLELTNRCNLSCIHCLQSTNIDNKVLSYNEIVNIAENLSDIGVFSIFLTGGEPLLRKNWYEIGIKLVNMGFVVGISTNGCLITPNVAIKIRDGELYHAFQMSLDGSTASIHDKIRGKGSFNNAMKGLDNLAKVGIFPNLAVTVMKYNSHDIGNIIQLAIEHDLPHVHVMSLMPSGRAKKYFDKLEPNLSEWQGIEILLNRLLNKFDGKITIDWTNRSYRPTNKDLSENNYSEIDRLFSGCPAGKSKALIDAQGNVYGCDLLKTEEFCAGSVRDSNFIDIWKNSEVFKTWRNRQVSTIQGVCSNCKWVFACVGGCPAKSVYRGYGIFDSDPDCPVYK